MKVENKRPLLNFPLGSHLEPVFIRKQGEKLTADDLK